MASAGEDAAQILAAKHKVLLTLGLDPMLDTPAVAPLSDSNESIIALGSFDSDFIQQQAEIVLPLAAVFETSGTYVNVEGLWQSFRGCVAARGDSRPGWKIFAALGQALSLDGFGFADSAAVRAEIRELCSDVSLSNLCGIESALTELPADAAGLQKLGMIPIYAVDEMSRLAKPLQATPLMRLAATVSMSRAQAEQSKLLNSEQVQVKQGKGTAVLPLRIDDGVAQGCVCVPMACDATRHLSTAFGKISLEKVT